MIGRFAPSPTGPLHFGSLVTAVASYCDCKSQGGQWLLRIEDVDQTRSIAGAAESMIQTLADYGFEWDADIVFQSQRTHHYAQALEQLRAQDMIYPCTCSRKEIADSSSRQGIEGVIYPRTCLQHAIKSGTVPAWRMRTENIRISFEDAIQGRIAHDMANDIGDYVLKRADGLFTYQLAVVVDDALQGVTHVVRGADLLNSTTRQILLQQALNIASPRYAHVPLVLNAEGQKLSKQTMAQPLPSDNIKSTLLAAFKHLNRHPNPPIHANLAELWKWACETWQPYTPNMITSHNCN